jgi:hypothetical protein
MWRLKPRPGDAETEATTSRTKQALGRTQVESRNYLTLHVDIFQTHPTIGTWLEYGNYLTSHFDIFQTYPTIGTWPEYRNYLTSHYDLFMTYPTNFVPGRLWLLNSTDMKTVSNRFCPLTKWWVSLEIEKFALRVSLELNQG